MKCVANFDKPTCIQAQCWPICLRGRDLVGIAATGSGKTLGFGLPGLTHIMRQVRPGLQPALSAVRRREHAAVEVTLGAINAPSFAVQGLHKGGGMKTTFLTLAPTRELAMQSAVVLEAAGKPEGIKTVCVYGGVPKNEQRKQCAAGAHVLIATPGRLLDLCDEKAVNLSGVSYLVLDEADRMLDLGARPSDIPATRSSPPPPLPY